MALNQLHLLLFILAGVFSEEYINHNYEGKNTWILKAFYDSYEEDLKLNHSFRILKYFDKEKLNDVQEKSYLDDSQKMYISMNDSVEEDIKPENIYQDFDGLANNSPASSRKADKKQDLYWIENHNGNVAAHDIPELPSGKVEIHVFRGPNTKYTNVHGHSKYFAPWGYFVTQPVNPDYTGQNIDDLYFLF